MSQVNVGPGGFQDNASARGWNRITLAALAGLVLLLLAFSLFVVTQAASGGSWWSVRFFPSGIDRERTLPVEQAPPQPGHQLQSGGARGPIGGDTGVAGGTVSSTGGMTGGPQGTSSGDPSAGAGQPAGTGLGPGPCGNNR